MGSMFASHFGEWCLFQQQFGSRSPYLDDSTHFATLSDSDAAIYPIPLHFGAKHVNKKSTKKLK
jgi:hypothetical protein